MGSTAVLLVLLAEFSCEAVGVVEADLDASAVDAALAQRALAVGTAGRQAEVAHAAVSRRARRIET